MELLLNCRLTNGHPTYPLFQSDVFKMVMVRQGLKHEICFLRLDSTTDSRLFSCAWYACSAYNCCPFEDNENV